MIDISNFYKIPVELESFMAANFLAKIRIKYEYQRAGHNYNYNNSANELQNIGKMLGFTGSFSLGNIAFGILSEMLIYKDLTEHLYKNLNNNMSMINKNFKYNLVVGEFDQGYDFIKDKFEIDVKHYSTRIFTNTQEILNYNLLVDQKQYNNHQADIYIQSFTLAENNKPYIIIAGYAQKDMLVLNSNFPNSAYCCKVINLLTYKNLKNRYFQ